jgi:prepilin-type N-terminal cleavage/methylation domain-containing protein
MFKSAEKGVSLIEMIVAVALVAVMILGIAQLGSLLKVNTTLISGASCRDVVSSSLSQIAALGSQGQIDRFLIQGGGPHTPDSSSGSALFAVDPSVRWPGTGAYRIVSPAGGPADPPNIRNSDLAFCTSPDGLAYGGAGGNNFIFNVNQPGLNGLAVRLRVQPFELNSNRVAGTTPGFPCPAAPIIVRPLPRDQAITGLGMGVNGRFNFAPNSRDDIGFLATVHVAFTDALGRAQSCQGQQRFSYFRDDQNPSPAVITQESNSTGSLGACNYGARRLEVRLAFAPGAPLEPGAVVLCRERGSEISNADTHSGRSCPRGGIAVPGIGTTWTTEWGPCDRVTACGNAPISASASLNPGGPGPRYDLVYDNLQWNCFATIQMSSIDVAGNNVVQERTFQMRLPPCNPCATDSAYCPPAVCPPPPPPDGGSDGGDGGDGGPPGPSK